MVVDQNIPYETEGVLPMAIIHQDTVAIDATHFEARDQAPPKEAKPKEEPQKRGSKSKKEREQWLIEQAEKEANPP